MLVQGDNGQVFYGVLIDVIEVTYRHKSVFLFKCKWWDLRNKSSLRVDGSVTCIKVSRTWYDEDPYILSSQAKQVFYLRDMRHGNDWRMVQWFMHRHIYNMATTSEEANALTDVEVMLAYEQAEDTFRVENPEGLPIFVVLDCEFQDVCRRDVEPDVVDHEWVDESRREIGPAIEDVVEDINLEDDTLVDYDSSDEEYV